MYFLPNHIILIGNIKDLLRELDAFCFNYQRELCIYTFQVPLRGKIVIESGQLFDKMQRAVQFNQQNKGVDRMPSIAKKRLLRKKYKKRLLSSYHENKSTQTSESMFADRIEQVKKTKFEKELIKFVHCFLDGHGICSSNLVSLKNFFVN